MFTVIIYKCIHKFNVHSNYINVYINLALMFFNEGIVFKVF